MLNQETSSATTFSKKRVVAAFCLFSTAAMAALGARSGFGEQAKALRGTRILSDLNAINRSPLSNYCKEAEETDLDIPVVNFAPNAEDLFAAVSSATTTLTEDNRIRSIFASVNFANTEKMPLTKAAAVVSLAAEDFPELPLTKIPNYPTFSKLPFTYFKSNHTGKTLPAIKIKAADQILNSAIQFYLQVNHEGLQLPAYQEGIVSVENQLIALMYEMQTQKLPLKSKLLYAAKEKALALMPNVLATKSFVLDFSLMQVGVLQLIRSYLARNPGFNLSYADGQIVKKLQEQVNSLREALSGSANQVAQFMLILNKAADYAQRGINLTPSQRAAKLLPEFASAFKQLSLVQNAPALHRAFIDFSQNIDIAKNKSMQIYMQQIADGIQLYNLQGKYHADINKFKQDANFTKDVTDGFNQMSILKLLGDVDLNDAEQQKVFGQYTPRLQILANQANSTRTASTNKVFGIIRVLIDDIFAAGIMATADRKYDLGSTLALYWLRANQEFVLSALAGIKAGADSNNQHVLLDVMYRISYGVILTINSIIADDKKLKP